MTSSKPYLATPTKQSIVAEYWYRGRLQYKLHKGQKEIESTLNGLLTQLRVINCSRQFGKTFFGVQRAVSLCLRKPKARVKIGTAFLTDLAELIIPAFDAVLADCPAKLMPKYKTQGSKYVFPNGSEIKLVGLDKNPNGLRGQVPDLIILEEAGFISNLDYLYTSVLIPATTHRPDCEIILISTPPSTPAHPFVNFAQRAELEGGYAEFTILDNPRIGPDTILRLMKESNCSWPCSDLEAFDIVSKMIASKTRNFPGNWVISNTFRREYMCEFILDDDLALCKEWKDEYIQEVTRDEFRIYYHNLVGQDLGRKDHTALIFGYYDFKRSALIIEDELTMDGPAWTTETLKNAILKMEKNLWHDEGGDAVKPFRRVSDNNNPHLLNDLSSIHNLHFMPVKKDSSLEQMVNRVREWVNQGRILINPKCKMLIGNLKYGVWDKNRKEFAKSKIYGHFDHFAALMYLLIHTPVSTNPIPATHGQTYQTFVSPLHKPNLNASRNAQTMQKALLGRRKKF